MFRYELLKRTGIIPTGAIFTLLILSLSACNSGRSGQAPIPDDCRQLILVTTPSRRASQGTLYRFEHNNKNKTWRCPEKYSPVPIVLGRSGLGWGLGLHSLSDDLHPRKREGDGRSPEGIFFLGAAFGRKAPTELEGIQIPYRQITKTLECIDDTNSQYYNRLVENDQIPKIDWHSSEVIHCSPTAYYLGVVVEHNYPEPVRGAGSCIFLHCWTGAADSTAGCTTMSPQNMETLIRWLQESARPILVQLTRADYLRYRQVWRLPKMK